MTTAAASAEAPVARSYTRARRHPWVMGKLGEIRLWLGPYTRPQLVVAGVGLLVLGKTIPLWAPTFGPLPLVVLAAAVWAVRHARIGGRVPEAALWGLVLVLVQPRAGRVGGRAVKAAAPARLDGGFFVTETHPANEARPATGAPRTDGMRARRVEVPRRHRPVEAPQHPAPANTPAARRTRGGRSAGTSPDSRPSPAAGAPRSALDLLLEQAGARTPHTDKE